MLTRWQLRHSITRLYHVIIGIRDASWSMLGRVDDDIVAAAIEFAGQHHGKQDEVALASLAEACWLSYAVRVWEPPVNDTPLSPRPETVADPQFLRRSDHEPLGSIEEELAFLGPLADAWRDPLLIEFHDLVRQRHRGAQCR